MVKIWDSGGFNLKEKFDDIMVRAPGLEPKTSTKEIFLLLKEISTLYLEDIRKGKTGTVKQLLTLLSGVKQ